MPRNTLIQKRRGTAAAWTSANPMLAAGEEGYETDTRKSKVGDGSTAWTGLSYTAAGSGGSPTGSAGGVLDGSYPNPGLAAGVAGAGLAETSDVLSVNVDGSTIEINADTLRVKAGGIGANELASTAVTPTTYGDATHVGQFTVDADGRITAASAVAISGAGGGGAGSTSLVYRYTVAGSDKASIDTGADTADAGSNDWTNGDVLEIWMTCRSDNAAARVSPVLTVNNDTGSNYDLMTEGAVNTTVAAAPQSATAGWSAGLDIHGSGGSASYPSCQRLTIPNFSRTTFFKVAELTSGVVDATAGNNSTRVVQLGWRSTAAITRFKIAAGGADKLKVGSQLLIYKRLAS